MTNHATRPNSVTTGEGPREKPQQPRSAPLRDPKLTSLALEHGGELEPTEPALITVSRDGKLGVR